MVTSVTNETHIEIMSKNVKFSCDTIIRCMHEIIKQLFMPNGKGSFGKSKNTIMDVFRGLVVWAQTPT